MNRKSNILPSLHRFLPQFALSTSAVIIAFGFLNFAVQSNSQEIAPGTTVNQSNAENPRIFKPKAVVELFTSQGCSSCPPADKLMNALAERDELLALTLPIQYWDYLGWKDTLATPSNTFRQQSYANYFASHKYTPQLVINGRKDLVGSKKKAVLESLSSEISSQSLPIDMSAKIEDGVLQIDLPEAPSQFSGIIADLIVADYHTEDQIVPIKKGENRNKTIAYSNVVYSISAVEQYDGTAKTITIPPMDVMPEACAILLQDRRTGRILSALKLVHE